MTLQAVDDNSFENAVLKAPSPVIVLFSDESKTSSKNMIRSLEEVAQDQGSKIKVVNKAIDKNGTIEKNRAYDIQSAPTTLFFKGGKLVRTVVGFYNYSDVFKTWVDELAKE